MLRRRFRPETAPLDAAVRLGREGEKRAARFLRQAGYKILCRNFRPFHGGEVDIVCRVRGTLELVFVEVKTRSSETYGAPAEAVDWEKQRRIVRAAAEWYSLLEQQEARQRRPLQRTTPGITIRFDVVELLHSDGHWEIRHWKDAFTGEETRHPGSHPLIPGASRGDVLPKRVHEGGAPSRRRPGRG
jgi:putative endonuclease